MGQEGWLRADGRGARVSTSLPEALGSSAGRRVHAVGTGFVGGLHFAEDPKYSIVLEGDKNVVRG